MTKSIPLRNGVSPYLADADYDRAAEVAVAVRYAISRMNDIKTAPTVLLEPDDDAEFEDGELGDLALLMPTRSTSVEALAPDTTERTTSTHE